MTEAAQGGLGAKPRNPPLIAGNITFRGGL